MRTLLLLSKSPRRIEILNRLGVRFETRDHGHCESLETGLSPREAIARVTSEKINQYLSNHPHNSHPLLAADTMIHHQGRTLGKPRDRGEASEMLASLSNSAHEVITGVGLFIPFQPLILQTFVTRIHFRELDEKILGKYLDSGEWTDAAGAYKIQETGEILIEKIEGSFSNVVGLPISSIYDILSQHLPECFTAQGK